MTANKPLIFINDEELGVMIERVLECCGQPAVNAQEFASAIRGFLYCGSLSVTLQITGDKRDRKFAWGMLNEIKRWLEELSLDKDPKVQIRYTHLEITLRVSA